jgi:predicted ATP-binding protein involved in virulence
MEIRRIRYKNIYGWLSGDLTFSRGENFLVGINGCGKTTVLNLIRWILEPSLPDLCTLEHDSIKLDLEHNNDIYSIESQLLKDKHELKVITKKPSRDFNTISTPLKANPKLMRGHTDLHELKSQYKYLSPEPQEVSTWNFLLEELPSPVFVGLEREIHENRLPSIRNRIGKISQIRDNPSPVSKAVELMRDAFNPGRQLLVNINEELNRKVLELSFSGILRPEVSLEKINIKKIKQKITQLKMRFEKLSREGIYSKALSSDNVRSAIIKYLEDLEALLSNHDKIDKIWITLNQVNFNRVSKMFDLFINHEQRVKEVQVEIETFTSVINDFLKDSGKNIHFNENTGVPYFSTTSFNHNLFLSELSSGETQIVILLSYFAFLAKKGIPIIIDEPELSLHVEWQKYFVEAVKKVMPSECQTIMATHSPEICGADNVNVQAITLRSKK